MTRVSRHWLLWAVVLAALLAPTAGRTAEPAARPATWATKLERVGLSNLYQVNDNLYRGAQPTAEGMKELNKMGVRTIVNLRAHHSDSDIHGDTGLVLKQIPVDAWNVTDKDIVEFLKIVTDKNNTPVFVHCEHGADRTGAMCAAYRVAVDGWTKQQALDEMTRGGYGFHPIWKNLPKLIENLDVEKIKAQAGLNKPAQP